MITSKKELEEYIAADNNFLRPENAKAAFIEGFAHYPVWELRRFLRQLRKQEYCINTANGSRARGFLGILHERRKNRLGNRLGLEIPPNTFGKGLSIWHVGSVIVNSGARIGENCTLHGANCIGNNGITPDCPIIGNHVDIGYGAVVIGGVIIADDITIGANAVVNRSFTEPGVTLAGAPARIVKQAGPTREEEIVNSGGGTCAAASDILMFPGSVLGLKSRSGLLPEQNCGPDFEFI